MVCDKLPSTLLSLRVRVHKVYHFASKFHIFLKNSLKMKKKKPETKTNEMMEPFYRNFSWLTILNCVSSRAFSQIIELNSNQDFSQFVRDSFCFHLQHFWILLTLSWINTQQSILRQFILVIFTLTFFFFRWFSITRRNVCVCLCAALKRLMLFLQVLYLLPFPHLS